MPNRLILIITLVLIIKSTVFTQENVEFPRNSLSFDALALLSSSVATGILSFADGTGAVLLNMSGQYEYQLSENFSLAARLEFKMFNFVEIINLSSVSMEMYGRYYPSGKFFFLDAMAGYALFNMTAMPASHFFKYGGRLGWRIDFKEPGGFFIEPYIGYSGSFGKSNVDFNFGSSSGSDFSIINDIINSMYNFIIKGYFVSGPMTGLSIGYRF